MSLSITSFIFKGGLDLATPYLLLEPGRCIDAVNYETLPFGGYRRIDGYLLYDGQTTGMAAVPGEGAILGVWIYMNEVYAFRNATGGATTKMYKATGAGWVEQSLGNYILFDGGTTAFVEGESINGQTSGATATVRRISIYSGTTTGGDQTGLLTLSDVVGTFQNNENLRSGTTVRALANGTLTANTIPPDGAYRFWNYNFLANAGSQRMYGCNGVGPAFEWDGTYFTPIIQQSGGTYPSEIVAHADHLFLGFGTVGILRNSSIGNPLSYISTTGAADIGVGDMITDLRPNVGGVLFIGCESSVQVLYGTNAVTWEKKRYSDQGIRQRTLKEIGGGMLGLDDRGVQRVDQSQAFGDFQSATLSIQINKRLLPTVQLNADSIGMVSKTKDQYRLFFGKQGYYFSFNRNRLTGIMPVQYNDEVLCAADGEDPTGAEMIVFGSKDGKVFRMGGFNFNGTNILASLQLVFHNAKSPTQRKQYRKAVFFIDREGATNSISARAFFSLGGDPATEFANLSQQAGAGEEWDVAEWDTFEWADEYGSEASFEIDGTGTSMSLAIYSGGAENGTHAIQSAILHYSPRRLMRAV